MAEMLLLNPRKRKHRSRRKNPIRAKVTRHRKRVHSKVRRHSKRRHYKSNPIRGRARRAMGGMKGLGSMFTEAFIGAGGALGLDVLMGYIPLPAAMQTGIARHATKAVGAVLLGMVGGSIMSKSVAGKMANGALTVVFHDALLEQIKTSAPTLKLGEYTVPYYPSDMPQPALGYYQPGQPVDYDYTNMGEYVYQ